MGTRTDSRAAEIVLPLATGLLIVAISSAVSVRGAGLLGLMVLLTLGAVLPGKAWRTGAIAAAPLVVAAVLAGAGDSHDLRALWLVFLPTLVALCAAAVKVGAMLVAPASAARDAGRAQRQRSAG